LEFGIKYKSGQWDDLKEKREYWKLEKEALCGELDLEEAMDLSIRRTTE
jgi:hypothetical protein